MKVTIISQEGSKYKVDLKKIAQEASYRSILELCDEKINILNEIITAINTQGAYHGIDYRKAPHSLEEYQQALNKVIATKEETTRNVGQHSKIYSQSYDLILSIALENNKCITEAAIDEKVASLQAEKTESLKQPILSDKEYTEINSRYDNLIRQLKAIKEVIQEEPEKIANQVFVR